MACLAALLAASLPPPLAPAAPAGEHWVPRAPSPERNPIWGLAAKDDAIVAGGEGGLVLVSTDGEHWLRSAAGLSPGCVIYDIASDGGQFVAVGKYPNILRSTDGWTWQAVSSPTGKNLSAIHWNGSRFVAVGEGPTIVSSANGTNWQSHPTGGTTGWFTEVTWNGSLWMAVGWPYTGSTTPVATSTDGINWSRTNPGILANPEAVAWLGSRFVVTGAGTTLLSDAIQAWEIVSTGIPYLYDLQPHQGQLLGCGSGAVYSSPDGIRWNPLQEQMNARWNALVPWRGRWFVAGTDGSVASSGDLVAWTRHCGATTVKFTDLCRGPNAWLGVGINGLIARSDDGMSWSLHSAGSGYALNGAAWSPTTAIAVGASGVIHRSPDGRDWQNIVAAGGPTLRDVCWTGQRWIAVGDDSTILASEDDGLTWEQVHGPGAMDLAALCQGPGKLVAGGSGSPYVLWSPDGRTWQPAATSPSEQYRSLAYANGRYVAASNFGRLLVSPDAEVWTTVQAPHDWNCSAVAGSDGDGFAVVGDHGSIIRSDDGLSWELLATPTADPLVAVAAGQGEWLAAGSGNGNGTLVHSRDSRQWNVLLGDTAPVARSLLWTGDHFLAAGLGPRSIYRSPDGLRWSATYLPPANFDGTVLRLRRFQQEFFATMETGRVCWSSDGDSWNTVFTGSSRDLHDLAWSPDRIVVVGASGTILASSDRTVWTPATSGTSATLRSVIHRDGFFLAAGDRGTVLRSPDGLAWTTLPSFTTNPLKELAWIDGRYYLVGSGVFSSADGLEWQPNGTLHTVGGNSIACSGNRFALVSGSIWSSPDALAWTDHPSGTNLMLEAAVWTGDQFLAVGNGAVVSSEDDYDAWASDAGLADESARWEADPDRDCVANALHRYLGLPPHARTRDHLPRIDTDAEGRRLRFVRRSNAPDDTLAVIEWSPDASQWQEVARKTGDHPWIGTKVGETPLPNRRTEVSLPLPLETGPAQGFYRLRLERIPGKPA